MVTGAVEVVGEAHREGEEDLGHGVGREGVSVVGEALAAGQEVAASAAEVGAHHVDDPDDSHSHLRSWQMVLPQWRSWSVLALKLDSSRRLGEQPQDV